MDTNEDVKAISERMALNEYGGQQPCERYYGFRGACDTLLPHILSLMARVKHDPRCKLYPLPEGSIDTCDVKYCTCGWDAELKSIEELIHPTK